MDIYGGLMRKLIFILIILGAIIFLAFQAQAIIFISGTSASGGCTWSTVWDAETVSGDTTWADFNAADRNTRTILDNTDTTGGGSEIRITLRAHSTLAATVSGASIGLRSASTQDYASTPTNITWDTGSESVTITAGADKTSDNITFNMATGSNYLVAYATDGDMQYLDLVGGGYRKATSTDETMDITVTGYSDNAYIDFLVKVEACN